MNQREKTSLKNMEYNRYIALRYSLALFFFANLNWLVFLLTVRSVYTLLPFVMLVLAAPSIMEQIKVYSQKTSLTHTTRYFKSQLLLNGLLCALAFVPAFFKGAFPFMAVSAQGLIGLQTVLVLGTGIAYKTLQKINAIHQRQDRMYHAVLKYKNTLKASDPSGK